jgi:hypothetical protein
MKILKKKILRVVPLWIIIATVLSAGTALAAYTWMSNQIFSVSNVTNPPLVLSGTLARPIYKDLMNAQNLTYTVNSGTPTGYIILKINGPNIASTVDVDSNVIVYTNSGTTLVSLAMISNSYSTQTITRAYALDGVPTPINFGNTSGNIEVQWTSHVLGNTNEYIQVSSTPS